MVLRHLRQLRTRESVQGVPTALLDLDEFRRVLIYTLDLPCKWRGARRETCCQVAQNPGHAVAFRHGGWERAK